MSMFPAVTTLINYHTELTVILYDITQDSNKVLGDERNKTVNFRRLDNSMYEDVATFQSVVKVNQQNVGPKQNLPLEAD